MSVSTHPKVCCCCFPLRLGCVLVSLYNFVDCSVKLWFLVRFLVTRPRPYSLGEYLWLYLTVLQCGAQLTVGVCVLLGTVMERVRLLQLCGGSLLLLSFVSLTQGTAAAWSTSLPRTFLTYLLDFILLSFCSFVVWAFVGELKEYVRPGDRDLT